MSPSPLPGKCGSGSPLGLVTTHTEASLHPWCTGSGATLWGLTGNTHRVWGTGELGDKWEKRTVAWDQEDRVRVLRLRLGS